ncbi:ribonuclease H-like domain-containing protein [Rhizophagus diaphanus]|nr:ribonuclease H-like domain-containing protein [Rhizophagus diaphanus] [Rhizophagus sp. MUCL 43196]
MEVIYLSTEFVKRPGLAVLFDGHRNIYTSRQFPFGDIHTLDVTMPEDNTNNVDRRPSQEINMFLNRRGSMTSNVLTGIMALNGSQSLNGGVETWQQFNTDRVLNKRTIEELRDISERDRLKIENFLKNLKIYATHDKNALNRRFRISKVTNTSNSNTTTFDDNGNQTDVASYFQRKYNMQLQYPFLPCIVIREETYLPLEVCNVVEVCTCIGILNYQQNEYTQQLIFGDSTFTPRNGLWNLRDKKVATGATLGSWVCVAFGSENDFPMSAIQKFIRELPIALVSESPTIILGASVIHPVPGDTSRPSIAAVTASIDAMASLASIRVQTCRQEIISDLADMTKELLKNFTRLVKENRKTFVVAQKRHRTRFFPIDKKDGGRTGNCLPGTVVESTITHPFRFDFYLQSHTSLQGAPRPTHYHVLFDENGFSSGAPMYYTRLVCRKTRFHANARDVIISEDDANNVSTVEDFRVLLKSIKKIAENLYERYRIMALNALTL